MKTISFFVCCFLLESLILSSTSPFANAQTVGKSLRVEMDPQGIITTCCTDAFYNATNDELFSFVQTTTLQVLQGLNLSLNGLIINKFVLVNSNSCRRRQRSLRTVGNDVVFTKDGVDRTSTKMSSTSTCSACTKSSCSSSCSGCYMCASSRRELSTDEPLRGLVGGLVPTVLGVTVTVLYTVLAAIIIGIQPHFAQWLSTGPGAALAQGCMGSPSLLQVVVSLE